MLSDHEDEANHVDEEESSIDSDDEVNMVHSALSDVNEDIERDLANRSFLHGYDLNHARDVAFMQKELDKPEDYEKSFKGVMVDTGANRSSVMSIQQYRAYCKEHLLPASISAPVIDRNVKKRISGFGGMAYTIGKATILIPIAGIGISVPVKFHIVEHNVVSVCCLKDMVDSGMDISIQRNCFILD